MSLPGTGVGTGDANEFASSVVVVAANPTAESLRKVRLVDSLDTMFSWHK
jgi:hypothetical protein